MREEGKGTSCYVCGAPCVSDSRNPLCPACAPARAHVVAMSTRPGGVSVARCACGWFSINATSRAGMVAQDRMIAAHWRDVIAEPEMFHVKQSAAPSRPKPKARQGRFPI